MALITKPAPGTGATKLLELISIIATGEAAEIDTTPEDEEEMEKGITGFMRAGTPLIFFDNLKADIKQNTLSRALTSRRWRGRTLGKTQMQGYPARACFYATGNNVTIAGTWVEGSISWNWTRKWSSLGHEIR